MDPRIKTKWLEALRSREYKQTKGKLKNDDGFCCLGVLCDIHAQEAEVNWYKPYNSPEYTYIGNSASLPRLVQDWAYLNCFDPPVKIFRNGVGATQVSLSHLNDILGYNFDQIADIIEEQL